MFYFAYGSNMPAARLTGRVPSVRLEGIGSLQSYDLRFHKISTDGSGKCDAFYTGEETDSIWGAIYRITPEDKKILDKYEPGYEAKEIEVVTATGGTVKAFTYYALNIDEKRKPLCWYRHHVIAGAEEHGFPEEYIEYLKAVEFIRDGNQKRREKEMRIYKEEIY